MRIEPTVTLVNRLVDEAGELIPQEFMFDGECVWVRDKLTVPVGIARVLVHHSMFKMDAFTNRPQYKLGVEEWGLPTTPITPDEIGDELVDRESLGWPRQTVKGKVLKKGPPLRNVAQRHDALSVNDPRGGDGAFPGFYGEPK